MYNILWRRDRQAFPTLLETSTLDNEYGHFTDFAR
jgi:hypothetical protein